MCPALEMTAADSGIRCSFVMLSIGYSRTDYTFLFVSSRPVVRIQNLVSENFPMSFRIIHAY